MGGLVLRLGTGIWASGVDRSWEMSSVSDKGEEASAGSETAPWVVEKRMCGMASWMFGGVESQEATGTGGEELGKARVVV